MMTYAAFSRYFTRPYPQRESLSSPMLKYGSDYWARVFCVTPTDSHAQSFQNATMCREAGARRGVHFNPECSHSVLPTVRAWTREWAQEGYKYTQVYAWELVVSWIWQWGDWSSHSRQTLCWIQLKHGSKNLSSKYILYKYEIIHAWCIRFELLSDVRPAYNKSIHKI